MFSLFHKLLVHIQPAVFMILALESKRQECGGGRRKDKASEWPFLVEGQLFELPSLPWHCWLGDRKSIRHIYGKLVPLISKDSLPVHRKEENPGTTS